MVLYEVLYHKYHKAINEYIEKGNKSEQEVIAALEIEDGDKNVVALLMVMERLLYLLGDNPDRLKAFTDDFVKDELWLERARIRKFKRN